MFSLVGLAGAHLGFTFQCDFVMLKVYKRTTFFVRPSSVRVRTRIAVESTVTGLALHCRVSAVSDWIESVGDMGRYFELSFPNFHWHWLAKLMKICPISTELDSSSYILSLEK